MRYCRRLFWSEGLEKKKETIIRKLNENRLQWDLFVVTLPEGEKNQLEIYNTVQFLQPAYPMEDYLVVGIARGYDAAVELVEAIVEEVYRKTGGADVRSFILEKEQEE